MMLHHPSATTVVRFLLAGLLLATFSTQAAAGPDTPSQSFPIPLARDVPYLTRNIFVVSIGGMRYADSFGAANPASTIPCMWNLLRPQGSLYGNVYNLGRTQVTAGNYSIVDGCLEVAEPSMYYYRHLRPSFPTIFEYYRAAYPEVPVSNVWVVAGHRQSAMVNFSSHPLFYDPDYSPPHPDPYNQYPQRYQASVDDRFNAEKPDDTTWGELRLILEQHHPSMVFVQLAGIDRAVERYSNWGSYLAAIGKADWAVGQVWEYIQNDPQYRDQTTLIVTGSHGRDDNLWKQIGGISSGCRHTFALALGPDIKKGLEYSQTRYLTDICPTVGELMGFATPLSTGRVLGEMIQGYADQTAAVLPATGAHWLEEERVIASRGLPTQPRVAFDDAALHVAWAERRGDSTHIYYTMRAARDADWSEAFQVSSSRFQARAPTMALNGDKVHFVWLEYQDGQWAVVYRQREDDGQWTAATVLAESIEDDSGTGQMAWEPAITVCDGQVLVAVPFLPSWLRVYRQQDDGTWTYVTLRHINTYSEPSWKHAAWQGTSLVASGEHVHLLWQEIPKITWEMGHATANDCGESWNTDSSAPSPRFGAHDSDLAAAQNQLYAAWIELEHLDWSTDEPKGLWRSTTSPGWSTWTAPVAVTDEPLRHPRIAAEDDIAALAWEDHSLDAPRIQVSYSNDRGQTWQLCPLTEGTSLVADPAVATNGQDVEVVWRDFRDGTWQLYHATINDNPLTPTPSPTATETLVPSPTATLSPTSTVTASPTLQPTSTASPSGAKVQLWLPVILLDLDSGDRTADATGNKIALARTSLASAASCRGSLSKTESYCQSRSICNSNLTPYPVAPLG